ncbi:hypothetical protein F5Y13DRAFT_154168 [Hypoxylon sp. FL1857]|nr:hypothetical protein F5Y13DRAFT_154168 [Hypoxylon sp. FL1857]
MSYSGFSTAICEHFLSQAMALGPSLVALGGPSSAACWGLPNRASRLHITQLPPPGSPAGIYPLSKTPRDHRRPFRLELEVTLLAEPQSVSWLRCPHFSDTNGSRHHQNGRELFACAKLGRALGEPPSILVHYGLTNAAFSSAFAGSGGPHRYPPGPREIGDMC